MSRLNPSSRFSKWVLPIRLIGLAIGVFGLLWVVVAGDALGILVAVVGCIVWQCGTFLEERSPGFQMLKRTLARDVMRTERINVAASLKVGKLREQWPASNGRTFFVTMQDGYESGIVLQEHLQAVSEDEARYLPAAQVARPITYIDSINGDDSLLTALTAMDRNRRDYVVVVDRDLRLSGVVTRDQIVARTIHSAVEAMPVSTVPSSPAVQ